MKSVESGEQESDERRVASRFGEVVNSHGYAFHQAVLRSAEVAAAERSNWELLASEIPVEVAGAGAHVDFALSHRHRPMLMIAECKRANPEYCDWCFSHNRLASRSKLEGQPIFERIARDQFGTFFTGGVALTSALDFYHVAVEVNRKREKPGSRVSEEDRIERASNQLCRAIAGMRDLMVRFNRENGLANPTTIIPVLFTTANLWISHIDLTSASLKRGEVDMRSDLLHQKPWVFYQYHMLPTYRREQCSGRTHVNMESMADWIALEYTRTLCIVSPSGIESFWRAIEDVF